MVIRYGASLVLATVLFLMNAIPAAEPEIVEPVEVEPDGGFAVGGDDLRVRRGYYHAWVNEAEGISVLYFVFDNGVLQFYQDEPGMGYVFDLDVSGLPDREGIAEKIVCEDVDGDGYADVKVPVPDGRFAIWRWNAEDGTFEATATSALLPAPAPTRKTLAALPGWTTPHLIVHLGEASTLASRLGYSWLLDYALDIRPERKGALEWLRSFPLESLSVVRGLTGDDADTFHGAVRFTEDKADILARLEALSPPAENAGYEAVTELRTLFYQLSGIPRALVGDEGMVIISDFAEERRNLYSLFIISNLFGRTVTMDGVFASVADADGEKLLLIGSSPDAVERARTALRDETARLEIVRRDPGKASFLQIVDDASGSGAREMADGMYWDFEPKAPVGLELSLGLPGSGIDLSLWHTFSKIVWGDSFRPRGGWRAEDAGFAFGGGYPWLAGALSPVLTEKNFLDLLTASARGDDDQVREVLKLTGVDSAILPEVFRSIGLVLGGNAAMHGEWVPGGYVFVSDHAEKMRTLVPVIKLVLDSKLSHSFQAVDREGWDLYYALNDEYRERTAGMPWCVGIKDGVFLMGLLEESDLEVAPEIDWPEDGMGEAVLLGGNLDFPRLVAQCREFLEAMPLWRAYEAASAVDLEELFTPRVWAGALRFFAATQEIEQVTLVMPDPDRLNLTIRTTSVDYENVWALMRTARMLGDED